MAKTFGLPGMKVSMASAEDMRSGDVNAIDWINLLVGLNQKAAVVKKQKRDYFSRAITGAAQGLTADMGSDELQSALNDIDAISLKLGENDPLRDFGQAHSNRIEGRMNIAKKRENTSRTLSSLRGELDTLTDLGKAGQKYDATEAMKILDKLNEIHTAGFSYLDKQLDYDVRELQQQSADVYSVLSYMEQLDTMDYIKEKAGETIGIQLAAAEKGVPIVYGGKTLTKETMARAAEEAFTAGNYAHAKTLLATMQLEEESAGLRLAEAIRTTHSDVELAEDHNKNAGKEGDIASEDSVFPTFQKLYGSVSTKTLSSPEMVESAFDEISSYIYKTAKAEEVWTEPGSLAELDEYLYGGPDDSGNRDRLITDIAGGWGGSKNLSFAIERLIRVREKMDEAYFEATGKRLIGVSKDIDELVFQFSEPPTD